MINNIERYKKVTAKSLTVTCVAIIPITANGRPKTRSIPNGKI